MVLTAGMVIHLILRHLIQTHGFVLLLLAIIKAKALRLFDIMNQYDVKR